MPRQAYIGGSVRWAATIVVTVAVVLLSASGSSAYVVHGDDSFSGNDPANVGAYSDFAYWSHIGLRGVGTGVYLDNGWVLAANHIGVGTINLHGTNYLWDSSEPSVRLQNPDDSFTDLRLFKVLDEPALLPTVIGAAAVSSGDGLLMTGCGYERAATSTTWDVNRSTNPWTWTTPATVPKLLNYTGYLTEATRALHWGDNLASSNSQMIWTGSNDVFGFDADFNSSGTTYEAAAVSGDSGGGVWKQTGDTWELVGVTLSVSLLSGQPDGTRSAILDNTSTVTADLSAYYDQIMAVIFEAPIPGDFNDDETANLLDIPGFILGLSDPAAYAAQYPQVDLLGVGDLNDNGAVDLLDIPLFINLLTGGGSGGAAGSMYAAVPEPASIAILIAAATSLLRRRRRPR